MKVLLVGSCNRFTGNLIDRFVKEGNQVSILSKEDFKKETKPTLKYTFYKNNEQISIISKTMQSVCPDTIFFMGDIYNKYLTDISGFQGKYLNLLINTLQLSKKFQVSKFIYMSTDEIYDSENTFPLNEIHSIRPSSEIGLLCQQGEYLCNQYEDIYNLNTIILRFAPLYGFGLYDNVYDPVCNVINHIEQGNEIKNISRHNYIHIKDATDAVLRVAYEGNCPIYNIGGNIALDEITIAKSVAAIKNTSLSLIDSEVKNYNIDNRLIKKDLEWSVHHEIPNCLSELMEIYDLDKKSISDHKEKRGTSKVKSFKNSTVALTLETIFMFLFFACLTLIFKDDQIFSQINFLIIYIIIIAVLHGMKQSILAVIFTSGFYIYSSMAEGTTLLNSMLNVSTILIVAQFILIGVIVGYAVERLRIVLAVEKNEYEYLKSEYEELTLINNENIQIKHEYEHRLIDSKDSLPRLYSVISKLNSLDREEIYPAAIGAISDILQAPGVGIYSISGKSSFIRLNCSTGNPGFPRKSINLEEYEEVLLKLNQGEIYVSDQWNKNIPQMISPIYSKGNLIALITINDLPFDKLTLYSINLLRTISALITVFIIRAQEFDKLSQDEKYLDSTLILAQKAFEEVINARKKASDQNLSEYVLIRIDSPDNAINAYKSILSSFRDTDYFGVDEDEFLNVLLSNSSVEDAKTVIRRLENLGVECSIKGEAI